MPPPEPNRAPLQLPLPLRLADHAAFDTLVPGANVAAFTHAKMLAEKPERGGMLWLYGPPGVGRSHVLQAACRIADAAGRRAMYLPLGALDAADAAPLLTALDALDFVAIDDIERAAGIAPLERALFDALHQFHTSGRALLMAAGCAPAQARFVLPDLASRAAGAIVYRIHALDDDAQLEALQRHAGRLGLKLDGAAARYLQSRVRREMPALCAWLYRLDAASLAAQRRITVPFIRESMSAADVG